MSESDIFLAVLFSGVTGALLGAVQALVFKRRTRTVAAIAAISGLCAIVIGATWVLCFSLGGAGFVGYLCNLLIAPAVYVGVFTGWNIYSFALGMLIEIGLMTLAGWLIWHWITER